MTTTLILSPTDSLECRLRASDPSPVYRTAPALPDLADRPNLVIVDLVAGGIPTLKQVRASDETLPIVALTRCASESELVSAYHAGVDDYQDICVPSRELVARCRAIVARTLTGPPLIPPLFAWDTETLRIWTDRLDVEVAGVMVRMSPTQARLLRILAERDGVPTYQREMSKAMGWDVDNPMTHEYAGQHVHQIRAKLKRAGVPDIIETGNLGYQLRVPA